MTDSTQTWRVVAVEAAGSATLKVLRDKLPPVRI
jgi:hypothetical protein